MVLFRIKQDKNSIKTIRVVLPVAIHYYIRVVQRLKTVFEGCQIQLFSDETGTIYFIICHNFKENFTDFV